MATKFLTIDLNKLQELHLIFSLEYNRVLRLGDDPSKSLFSFETEYSDSEFQALEKQFKALVQNVGLLNHYNELLAYYPVIQEQLENAVDHNSSGYRGIEYLNYLIKLLQFKEKANREKLTINIVSDLEPKLKFVIPAIDDLNAFMLDNIVKVSIESAKHASFSLRIWLHTIKEISIESLTQLKKALPKYHSSSSLNDKIAYASYSLIQFLNLHGMQNIHNDNYNASSQQALFIQNYLHLFGLIPGAEPVSKRFIANQIDLSFHQNLNNHLLSLKKSHTK